MSFRGVAAEFSGLRLGSCRQGQKLLLQHRSEHKSDIGLYAPLCAFVRVFDSIENTPQELPPEKLLALTASGSVSPCGKFCCLGQFSFFKPLSRGRQGGKLSRRQLTEPFEAWSCRRQVQRVSEQGVVRRWSERTPGAAGEASLLVGTGSPRSPKNSAARTRSEEHTTRYQIYAPNGAAGEASLLDGMSKTSRRSPENSAAPTLETS